MNILSKIIKTVKKLFSKLIPDSYRKDSSVRTSILKWLLIGLLIRVTLMPITVYYPDLLGIYWRSSLIAYNKMPWAGGGQMFAHYLHAFFLWIFKPLMPYFNNILYNPTMDPGLPQDMFIAFVRHPNVFRTLFLFKVPYLIFDVGCAFLLLRIFQDHKKGVLAFIFWIVNPIVIFATYIAARYEGIPAFFILLSLYYAKKNLPTRSLLSLGISVIVRWYPLILLPFFIIILEKKLVKRLKLGFWGLLPLGLMMILARWFGGSHEVKVLTQIPWHENFFAMGFYLGHLYDNVFIFVVAYTFLLLYAYFNTNYSFTSLWKAALVLLLIFFATCFFHVHYLMWLIPFLTLQIVEDRRFIGLFVAQVLCFVVYTFQWGQHLAGFLFTPLDFSYFANLWSPFKIINQYYPADKFISVFRSIFSGISLLMAYLIFKEFFRRKEGRDEA